MRTTLDLDEKLLDEREARRRLAALHGAMPQARSPRRRRTKRAPRP